MLIPGRRITYKPDFGGYYIKKDGLYIALATCSDSGCNCHDSEEGEEYYSAVTKKRGKRKKPSRLPRN